MGYNALRMKQEFGTKFSQKRQCDRNNSEPSVPDMAVQNCIGDSFRGATWVALHNGGGVGW
jgi:urocanate hydratase